MAFHERQTLKTAQDKGLEERARTRISDTIPGGRSEKKTTLRNAPAFGLRNLNRERRQLYPFEFLAGGWRYQIWWIWSEMLRCRRSMLFLLPASAAAHVVDTLDRRVLHAAPENFRSPTAALRSQHTDLFKAALFQGFTREFRLAVFLLCYGQGSSGNIRTASLQLRAQDIYGAFLIL
eukprot:gene25304-10958_t